MKSSLLVFAYKTLVFNSSSALDIPSSVCCDFQLTKQRRFGCNSLCVFVLFCTRRFINFAHGCLSLTQISKQPVAGLGGHPFTALNSAKEAQARLVKCEAHLLPGVEGCVSGTRRLLLLYLTPVVPVSPGLPNCFECCGKWIILKWKPGQIWFGLEITQGFKRSQQKGAGLVRLFCFQTVYR